MILQANKLCKEYDQGEKRIFAVRNATFSMEEGEFAAIVGTSGSGKSTLLSMLGGIEKPTSGEVILDGENLYEARDDRLSEIRNRQIGFVFQSYQLLPVLTLRENILIPQMIAGGGSKYYMEELCDLLGIRDRLDHLPSEASGGQQQRAAVARALVNKPKILFADEPTGNLDKQSAKELLDLLMKTREKLGQTILLVTHDPEIAARADTIWRMDGGVLEKEGGTARC
ncbi:MAG: ABC transporter ATP-binding protein [Ruminococcaceae bacterium]|jgi:putative ABC transport system ATP-binding protein|nr:ABC transporter ATP-binding protein [Oscillospiraceae bacterium]